MNHESDVNYEPRPEPLLSEFSRSTPFNWGAVFFGAIAGFGAAVLMAALGAALGLSAMPSSAVASGETATTVSTGARFGAVIWLLLTAIVVGFVSGGTMNRLARHDANYQPALLGTVNWGLGLLFALLVVSIGGAGIAGGIAGSMGARADANARGAHVAAGERLVPDLTTTTNTSTQDRSSVVTQDEPADASRVTAADAAAICSARAVAWATVCSLIVGLVATIAAAGASRIAGIAVPRFGTTPSAQ